MFENRVVNKINDGSRIEHKSYCSADLALFKPERFAHGETSFDCFHFVLPKKDVPPMFVDQKEKILYKAHIFSTNPDQVLQVSRQNSLEEVDYLSMFIEKKKLQELSKDAFNRSEVSFDNINNYLSSILMHHINLFIDECKAKQSGYQFVLDSIAIQISINVLRELKNNLPNQHQKRHYSSRIDINNAIDFLWENTSTDFSLETLCKVSNLSPYYFSRLFKESTGKTPYEYYMDLKINKAVDLFKSKKYSITEVSYMLGFSNHSHFTSVFKRKTGITPSIFIKSISL